MDVRSRALAYVLSLDKFKDMDPECFEKPWIAWRRSISTVTDAEFEEFATEDEAISWAGRGFYLDNPHKQVHYVASVREAEEIMVHFIIGYLSGKL